MATLSLCRNQLYHGQLVTSKYNEPDELIQTLQGLHLSETLEFDDDIEPEYDDIFSYSVKRRSMDVPPMELKVDEKSSESSGNRMAS